MRRRSLLAAALAAPLAAHAAAPVGRGVNITNWFRFPASSDPAILAAYLSDRAIERLRRVGFSHVRLPVSPEWFDLALVAQAVARLQARGLAVLVVPAPSTWTLETSAANRAALLDFWTRMAPALRSLDANLTWPEVLNEPVFSGQQAAWETLQASVLGVIRAALPASTVVLTGALWGGVDGLLLLHPVPDPNVVYSLHFYEPPELTSLAAYRPGLDTAALAALPFPVGDPASCQAAVVTTDATTRAVAGWYCGQRWSAASVAARFDQAAGWAQAHGTRVLLGEFGATVQLNAPARLAWIAAVRLAAEQRGMAWMLWGLEDVMGFDVPRPPPARLALDPALLSALGLRAG